MEFDEFDLGMTKDGCAYGRGFYFSNDLYLGRQYSGGADPYVARITFENPYVVDLNIPYEQRSEARRMFRPNKGARERLLDLGHDCVIVRQDGYIEMIVLDPTMIDSFGRRPDLSDYVPALAR